MHYKSGQLSSVEPCMQRTDNRVDKRKQHFSSPKGKDQLQSSAAQSFENTSYKNSEGPSFPPLSPMDLGLNWSLGCRATFINIKCTFLHPGLDLSVTLDSFRKITCYCLIWMDRITLKDHKDFFSERWMCDFSMLAVPHNLWALNTLPSGKAVQARIKLD